MRMDQKPYGPIFKKIFVSYIVSCVIILCITGLGYWNYYRMFKEKTLDLARQQASAVSAQVENGFLQIRQALDVLSRSRVLKESMEYSDEFFSSNPVVTKHIQDELRAPVLARAGIDAMAYFYDSNSIINVLKRRYNTSMMDAFCKSYDLSYEKFIDIIDYKGTHGSHVFEDGTIWMMQAVYGGSYERKAVLIIETRIDQCINYMDEAYRDNIITLKAQDTLLFSSADLDEKSNKQLEGAFEDSRTLQVNEEGFYFISTTIPTMGWQCFVGIPEMELFQEMRIFWIILAVEIIGAIVLMIVMSWKLAQKTYRPVEQMIHILNNGSEEKFKETYDSLSDKLKKLIDENRKMHIKEQESRISMNARKVSRVFNGDITDGYKVSEIIQEFSGIKNKASWLTGIIYFSSDVDELFKYDPYYSLNDDDMDLKFFVLKNVIDELLFSVFPGNIFCQEDRYVFCLELDDESQQQKAAELLQNLIEFYKKSLNIDIYIMIGRVRNGYENIPEMYNDLKEEMKYKLFWMDESAKGRVWMQDEQQEEQPPVSFNEYMDSSRKLFNCLDTEDYTGAYNVLIYIFQKTFSRNKKYLKYNIYRMYGLISTLVLAFHGDDNSEDHEFFENLQYEQKLLNVKNVEQLMNVSKELLEEIIRYNAGKVKSGVPAWMTDVTQYIMEHYTDPNISVSEIADRFQVSAPHLSRTFKSCTGIGVLEHIHKLRVEKAKECMAAGKNVREAAQLSGYLDTKALIRAFKRYEGITPGQYKDKMNS